MKSIVVNTRCLHEPLTGIQRYVQAILQRLGAELDPISPRRKPGGLRGMLWDQMVLPTKLGGRLLWSPSSSGPLTVSHQVVTFHDIIVLDHPEWFNPVSALASRFVIPRLARRSASIITVSEYTRNRILAHMDIHPEKIVVIPEGVDPRFFPESAGEIERVINRYGIPTRSYLLSVSTLEPRKNLGTLLQTWSEVFQHLPDDIWLVLSGEKGNPRVFPRLDFDRIPPRVHWTGRVEDADLPGLYSGARAFVFLSLAEGFGLPPLEAMACGIPVLASNCTSIPEVVGDDALMVNPVDLSEIQMGIVRVCGDESLRQRLVSAGLGRARRYDWDSAAARTLQVLQDEAASLHRPAAGSLKSSKPSGPQ